MSHPVDGMCQIETANRPIRLVPESMPLGLVNIRAASDNTGDVWIGSARISSTTGELRGHRLQANGVLLIEDGLDLTDWFLVGPNVGDYVYWGGHGVVDG